jgi:hypothetical protein
MEENTKQKLAELSALFTIAAKQAVEDSGRIFETVFCERENGIEALVFSLARLKVMETILIKSAEGAYSLEKTVLKEILTGISKTTLLTQAMSGFLSRQDLEETYGGLGLENNFDHLRSRTDVSQLSQIMSDFGETLKAIEKGKAAKEWR